MIGSGGARSAESAVSRRGPALGVAVAMVAVSFLPIGAAAQAPVPERLAGSDRFATAAAVSAATFAPGVAVAYVATGENFPDALAGGPLAGVDGAPMLLVARDRVPEATAEELVRLAPARIRVLGGPPAVSDAVVAALEPYTTGTVERIAGSDRVATAAAVAGAGFDAGVAEVFVATASNFPDALAGGAAGAARGVPVLLTHPDALPAATREALERLAPGRITVLGGADVVGDDGRGRAWRPDDWRGSAPGGA